MLTALARKVWDMPTVTKEEGGAGGLYSSP